MAPREGMSLTMRLGFVGQTMLAAGVPASLGMMVGSLTRYGLTAFVVGIWVALILGTLLMSVTAVTMVRRLPVWRQWTKGLSLVLLFGWAATLAAALGYPLGLLHAASDSTGSLAPFGWTALVLLVALAIPAWLVVRLLRDPVVRG